MAQPQTLTRKVTIGDRLIRSVQNYRRFSRLLFPSPAETQFVRVMRGHALVVGCIKSPRTGFPLTILWRGKILRNELIEREVRIGSKFADFATPNSRFLKAIEIDGHDWHRDVLLEQERDQYLQNRGWSVLHVPARRIWHDPRKVRSDVLRFLKS